jgi:hypothetical protein
MTAINKDLIYDAQAAIACGEAFQRIAKKFIPRIGLIKEKPGIGISNELGDVVVCATNLAFAIELFLKALLIQLNLPVPISHDLYALYKKIPQPVQTIINDVYNTKFPEQLRNRQKHGFTLALGSLEEPQWDDYKKVSASLPDLLTRSKDIYQSWRYVFEFRKPKDSPYQYHKFEYLLLWCAAEAIRVEVTVRLYGMVDTNEN